MPAARAQVHFQDPRVEITKIVVGSMDNNVFFVRCRETGDSAMIDAANEAPVLLDLCERLNVRTVLETHGHGDHIQAVPEMRAAGYEVGIGSDDAFLLPDHDFVIEEGALIEVGQVRLRPIHTPGHTPGSMCFDVEGSPVLMSGDTLFPGGPGATRFSYSSFDTIIESVERLFKEFPDDTIVMPGHGASTTIGNERPHLEEWIHRRW